MKELTINEQSIVSGGDFISGVQSGAAAGAVIITVLAVSGCLFPTGLNGGGAAFAVGAIGFCAAIGGLIGEGVDHK